MPNGHPYFLYSSEDYCRRCERPLCDHDRRLVYPDDGPPGSSHYEYFCPNGKHALLPSARDDEGGAS